ncbi:hypothetical protein NA8A_24024 [Nitratireductor indicus C115]|uniref:Uncharacterized protein n=2 Tax=Nitratireductor indicus TaxID=721133 RepID=K2NK42_9HYPH|nr:hypothetical protein [Nitratireductor indicus]EKF39815.1 hypothetical protein NA8A_24024 [Nitratireductor indicus C115]
MMKARVSAEGDIRFHPSQIEAGAFVWQPAKSPTKGNSIHALDLFIGRVPFAQSFDRSGEDGLSFRRSAPVVAIGVDAGHKSRDRQNTAHGFPYG